MSAHSAPPASSATAVVSTAPAGNWRQRWLAIVNKIAVHHDGADVRALVAKAQNTPRPFTIAFVNAHAMNMAASSPEFHQSLMDADILLRDGAGVAILMRSLGRTSGLNMNGTDLIPRILKSYVDQKVALFGTELLYLAQAEANLRTRGHGGSLVLMDGFKPAADYVVTAQNEAPALIVLGMGMPKQEAVAACVRAAISHPCTLVCGGAIIDFLGGKVSRAPKIIRVLSLEWLYRLGVEPKRMFTRYVIGNPLFLWRSILMALRRP